MLIMKAQTLHIENPSKELVTFFRKLRAEKEEHKAKLLTKKEFYFPKSK
jgi:superfamily I DNA and RNA helicase